MKSSSNTISKCRTKKINNTITYNQDVTNKEKILNNLQLKHDELHAVMTADYDKIPIPPRNVMDMIESLPIQNIGESYEQEKGTKFHLFKAMNDKDKIFKKNAVRQEELDSLKNKIEIAKIDLAMAKVQFVLNKY